MKKDIRIGFIGVGMMGHGMASNLVTKGYATTVLGRSKRSPIEDLVSKGATEGTDPVDIAGKSDIVFLCVADSLQVEEIVYGPHGLLSAARPGLIVVDTTTSDPISTAKIFSDFAEKGTVFVDAPLGRTAKEAAEGRLNVMVGAEATVLDTVRPVLEAFAENIFHVGGPGAGHKTKLVNNFIAMGQTAMIAEAFVAAGKAGIDIETFFKILSAGPANSGLMQLVVPSILDGTYNGVKFELDIARKDLRYYTHMTESLVIPSLIGEAVHQSMVQASALGFGKGSVVGLVRAQEKVAGIDLSKLSVKK